MTDARPFDAKRSIDALVDLIDRYETLAEEVASLRRQLAKARMDLQQRPSLILPCPCQGNGWGQPQPYPSPAPELGTFWNPGPARPTTTAANSARPAPPDTTAIPQRQARPGAVRIRPATPRA